MMAHQTGDASPADSSTFRTERGVNPWRTVPATMLGFQTSGVAEQITIGDQPGCQGFPAEHWDHLRTSDPIESVFATVRYGTVRTKEALSPTTARFFVFKLATAASKTGRRLKGENQLPEVVVGHLPR